MKNLSLLLSIPMLFLSLSAARGQSAAVKGYTAENSPRKVEIRESDRQRAADLTARMTLSEKIAYIAGLRSFYIRGIERLGIPEIRLADGPQGVRNNTRSTLYPCGMMTAATWNRDLALELGASLARDCRARGVEILLGPGVNICRSPLCGRNFEYFGEDPYLTSETAVGYILGLQNGGVMATIKHFALNNQEWSRHHVSSDADVRTMQEIYFPAFRKAVQQAGVGAVMDSYNLIWGVHASENRWLCRCAAPRLGLPGAGDVGLDVDLLGGGNRPRRTRSGDAQGVVLQRGGAAAAAGERCDPRKRPR